MAAVGTPALLQEVMPDTVKPVLQVCWQTPPAFRLLVHVPFDPLAGAEIAQNLLQVAGVKTPF